MTAHSYITALERDERPCVQDQPAHRDRARRAGLRRRGWLDGASSFAAFATRSSTMGPNRRSASASAMSSAASLTWWAMASVTSVETVSPRRSASARNAAPSSLGTVTLSRSTAMPLAYGIRAYSAIRVPGPAQQQLGHETVETEARRAPEERAPEAYSCRLRSTATRPPVAARGSTGVGQVYC